MVHSSKSAGRVSRQQADEQLQRIFDALNIGVLESDCSGVIRTCNRRCHQIVGYAPGALVGMRVWDIQPSPTEQGAVKDYLRRLVEDQSPALPMMTRCVRPGGSLVDLQFDWSHQRDDSGQLTGLISVVTDVSDFRTTSEALLRRTNGLAILLEASKRLTSTLELQSVLQATVDGVTKLAGLHTAAVYLLNNEQLMLWATAPPLPPEFPDWLRRTPPADHPHLRRTIAELVPIFVSDITALELTAAERAVVAMRDLRTVLYLPLVADEQVLGALVVGSTGEPVTLLDADIDLCCTLANLAALAVRNAELFVEHKQHAAQLERTLAERKAAEAEREVLQKQLSQAQRLETVGRLAGGVAHDFSNMLSAILASAELALPTVDPSSQVHADLQEIKRAAERSARLTSQLLAFARAQSATPRVLDLNSTIHDMLSMLRRLIGEGIAMEWSPCVGLWSVRLDPSQVDQLLVNLCVNARDALAGSGRIAISTANAPHDALARDVRFRTQPDLAPGDYVTLTFEDNGSGMDAATRDRLFEPFFTTKTLGRGTGLGLATVYGIVKQNGGLIHVSTELARGTVFTIALPRHDAPDAHESSMPPPSSRRVERHRILLVEDEPAVLAVARRILERAGYRVVTASSGPEALRLVEERGEPFDLLVTDVVMPGMSGPEHAARLVARQEGTRVLFMSGYAGTVPDGGGFPAEAARFLAKPFSAAVLLAEVRQVLAD